MIYISSNKIICFLELFSISKLFSIRISFQTGRPILVKKFDLNKKAACKNLECSLSLRFALINILKLPIQHIENKLAKNLKLKYLKEAK